MASIFGQSFKLLRLSTQISSNSVRFIAKPPYTRQLKPAPRPIFFEKPKPGLGTSFRRVVHFEDKYTVKPLEVTNLAGRDPITGRVVANGIGGGIKRKYHQIEWIREGPEEGPPLEEKVIQIMECGCRTAHIALVATGDKMKYILATEHMKAGDILKTSRFIPRIPVRASEGDCYPLGALPIGTFVHNVQLNLKSPYTVVHGAGTHAIIKRHVAGRVVIQMPSKEEWTLNPKCLATVGKFRDFFRK